MRTLITAPHIFDGLNESQKKAVTTINGPLLIVAGPGTGKTLTIVSRIAYLIHQGVKPENILAVTFTNRAAHEMRERTEAFLGKSCGNVFIGTFHLLGLRIIKERTEGIKGGVPKTDEFIIYSREEQTDLLKKIIKDFDLSIIRQDGRKLSYRQVAEKISGIKNFINDADEGMKRIYEKYQSALSLNSALDFDDLILRPIEMLGDNEVRTKFRNRFKYIMVDEYQDINPAQYRLLKLLSPEDGNLCAIGDSDQAIYAFRGADIANFLNFEKDFKNAKKIFLPENYRSTGIIVDASSSLIRNNLKRLDKEIKAIKEKGIPITVISVSDEKAEGEIIVRAIEERIGGTSHYQMMKNVSLLNPTLHSYPFSDFAVVFRTNAQAKALAESFDSSGIPFQIIGEKHLGQRNEIMNFVSLLRYMNSADNTYKPPVPEQGEADEKILKKFAGLGDTLSLEEFLKVIWKEPSVRKHCSEENFMFLQDLTYEYRNIKTSEAIVRFINEFRLLTPSDAFNPKAEAVTLMTLHMAKGLEFKVVFITGFEDGLIPYRRQRENIDIEEERRLFYVGMTRARDELVIIHARSRFLYGERFVHSPSPFLREIPDEYMENMFIPDRIKKPKKDVQMGLF